MFIYIYMICVCMYKYTYVSVYVWIYEWMNVCAYVCMFKDKEGLNIIE